MDQMATLFDRNKSTISRHISNVFEEGELERSATFANFATVQQEGGRQVERQIEHFNLDVIISVGYRVKSLRGTQFRQWATRRLNEYIRKGFALDDERLKNGGGRYFRDHDHGAMDRRAGPATTKQPPRAADKNTADYFIHKDLGGFLRRELDFYIKHIDAQPQRGFVTVTGTLPGNETCLVLWCDCDVLGYEGVAKLCDKLAINLADNEFDVVYLNGDHNIPTVQTQTADEGGATRVLKLGQIEPEFLARMFAVEDV